MSPSKSPSSRAPSPSNASSDSKSSSSHRSLALSVASKASKLAGKAIKATKRATRAATQSFKHAVHKTRPRKMAKHSTVIGSDDNPDADTIDLTSDGHPEDNELDEEAAAKAELERVQPKWTSPAYSFFSPKVEIKYEDTTQGRRYYQWFKCNARRCKDPSGGLRRYINTSDKTVTSNLKRHAERCFGEDTVAEVFAGKKLKERNGSIYSAFAHQGQRLYARRIATTLMQRFTHTSSSG
ncbi:hypothetical protein HGRIS_011178 [Hohenbuehelia grisea]|uniref:BED-type domain-containing protein n=1 Tax=Hohenbuehelia grisea TaxID=104357 RepID=A0ABR3JU93_9AGAR